MFIRIEYKDYIETYRVEENCVIKMNKKELCIRYNNEVDMKTFDIRRAISIEIESL